MKFDTEIFGLFDRQWALVTAGDLSRFNTMTIAWGGLGTLWGRPVATVYVRPTRYTHRFMEENDLFTVSFYPEECRGALQLLGSRSGRDGDKVAASGLTPMEAGGSVSFREASRTLVCKKIYRSRLVREEIPDAAWKRYYQPDEEPHDMYIGEVIDIL